MLKTISSITNALGALNYKGTWNASSNTPTLADGTGAKGDYYVVSTAGTQTFGGVQLFFGLGDWIAYNGAVWQRVEGGSDGNFANVTLTSTDAGATAAPLLDLYRDSATPAASDTLGEIEFNGEDSAGNKQTYGVIHGSILSPTSTAEQGQLHFETATAGALTEKMIIGTTNLVINEIGGVFNVRIEGDADANLFYTDATNDKVGIGTASPAEKLDVVGKIKLSDNLVIGTSGKGIDFSSGNGVISVGNASYNIYIGGGTYTPAEIYLQSTYAYIQAAYNNTTASAANVFVASSGELKRSTSALKYKQDVRDVEDFNIDGLRPVRYKSKCEGDDQTKDHFGLIADEAAEAGFEELVTRSETGEIEGFQYERLTVVLLKKIQVLESRLAALETK